MKKWIQAGLVLSVIWLSTPLFADESKAADFTKIRMDYAKQKEFSPMWESDEDREKITDLWDDGKIEEGMKLAKTWLKAHPVDAEMHAWYGIFLERQGDYQGYFRHMHIYRGLLASIADSGTGRSLESPMKVISVSEEYAILEELDAKLIQQSLVSSEAGAPCDEMECEINGKKVILYFDVSIPMNSLSKMFEPEGEQEPEPKKPATEKEDSADKSKDQTEPVETEE